jgi:hypothetical protein
VHADPLDEVGLRGDDGDLDVVGVQVAGEVSGCRSAGVPGPEDSDAVPHGRTPVFVACLPNETATAFLTGRAC